MKSFVVALLSVFVIAAPAADPQLQVDCDGPMTTTATPTKTPSSALSNAVMPALAMERRSSFATYYGKTFSDGQKLEKSIHKVGGLAAAPVTTSAWEQEESPRNIRGSDPDFIYKYKSGVASTQQKGADKIVIPGDLSKPTFLRKAQAFVNRELHVIGATHEAPGTIRRLQVYTQVFGCLKANLDLFIQSFKSYEPILSDIKREYDLIIDSQRNDLSQFEIVKSKLSVMEFRMQKEVEKVTHEAKLMIQELVKDNEAVQEKLRAKTQELMLMTKKNESLVQEQKRKAEMKPVESPEMVELKNLTQEYANYERRTRDLLDAKSNQVVDLISAKQKAIQENADLQLSISQVTKTLEEYKSKNIPAIIKELADVKEKMAASNDEKRMMYDELEKNYKNAKQAASKVLNTQLPDWEYIQSQFSSNIKDYWQMAKNMDYNDAIIKFIRELQKNKPKVKVEEHQSTAEPVTVETPAPQIMDQYFPAKGTDSSIPKYLRSKTKVLNRHLTKENCLLLIKDIWEAKTLHDATVKQTTLDEFFYLYLKKRFGNQDIICEWGYNLIETCQKSKENSPDCQMFLQVLSGDLHESSYSTLRSTIEKLKTLFYQNDMDTNDNNAKGFLDRGAVMKALNQFWPAKSKQQLYLLEQALINDQPGTNVIYRFLFETESESNFIELVKSQHLQNRLDYLLELENAMKRISRDDNLSVFEATKLFNELDSTKKPGEVDKLMGIGFGIKPADLKPRLMIPKKKFIEVIY
ncbi:Translin-associated factor X-interacting protein 1 [Terramyces sp. JEL0728]|nr:Translin-associated factor X-interacting protein 1 [Terramyces sp. JEL0728]